MYSALSSNELNICGQFINAFYTVFVQMPVSIFPVGWGGVGWGGGQQKMTIIYFYKKNTEQKIIPN